MSEMITQVPLLAVAQVVYVVTCLPAKGTIVTSTGTAAGEGGVEGTERRVVSGTHGPVGTGVVKSGKVGYRRKHHGHGKGDGIGSRLTVCFFFPFTSDSFVLSGATPARYGRKQDDEDE